MAQTPVPAVCPPFVPPSLTAWPAATPCAATVAGGMQRAPSRTMATTASASSCAWSPPPPCLSPSPPPTDYFLRLGLDALMQRLGEGDAGQQGTLPAKKEAVEAMPTMEPWGGTQEKTIAERLAVQLASSHGLLARRQFINNF
ncbi:hypothetical protein E2562_026600 [Oryza meyeriana var. granulata]|uniref:Uncharacterized protein n=1 Tax=Oryza meyeriana var. granulata TaxID=110450 RepID=A0A6G1CTW0_9ORYZ|nr:hypothetical protein E2562_026600 [Oryza meyeriana var. granulata]